MTNLPEDSSKTFAWDDIRERVDKIFYDQTRGKTVTSEQSYILDWAEERVKPRIIALLEEVDRKARIEALESILFHEGAYIDRQVITRKLCELQSPTKECTEHDMVYLKHVKTVFSEFDLYKCTKCDYQETRQPDDTGKESTK